MASVKEQVKKQVRKQWLKLTVLFGLCSALSIHYVQNAQMPISNRLASAASPLTPEEHPVTMIEISGPLADRTAEVSGLDWYGDWLILLPQYPERLGGNVFALPKSEILSFLNGEASEPLVPQPIPFQDGQVGEQIEGYERLCVLSREIQ